MSSSVFILHTVSASLMSISVSTLYIVSESLMSVSVIGEDL